MGREIPQLESVSGRRRRWWWWCTPQINFENDVWVNRSCPKANHWMIDFLVLIPGPAQCFSPLKILRETGWCRSRFGKRVYEVRGQMPYCSQAVMSFRWPIFCVDLFCFLSPLHSDDWELLRPSSPLKGSSDNPVAIAISLLDNLVANKRYIFGVLWLYV